MIYRIISHQIYLLLILLLTAPTAWAQVPPGYYDSAEGLTGEPLREALHQIIDNHDGVSYNSLWNYFEWTDQKPNGKVWDMYSDQPGGTPAYQYSFGSDQCGNYGGEGDCYNREHSFPQSWYGDGSPMKSDLFHVYPTDGYVNGKRGNRPFGRVGAATWTSTNGSKLGYSNWPGYSGIVFEPIDEYKGDFARSYFYMLTRYKPQISGWESDMLQGNNFSDWAVALLLEWAEADPVSQKEIDRNNEVYGFQENRNPYIDRPEFAMKVWAPYTGMADKGLEKIDILKISGELHLPENSGVESLYLFDAAGRHIAEWSNPARSVALPTGLRNGVYVAVAQSKSGMGIFRFVSMNH